MNVNVNECTSITEKKGVPMRIVARKKNPIEKTLALDANKMNITTPTLHVNTTDANYCKYRKPHGDLENIIKHTAVILFYSILWPGYFC